MAVFVNNLQEKVQVDNKFVDFTTEVVENTLMLEGLDRKGEVSLVFVDDDYIQQLNREYRGIDSPTDVLSFSMVEGEPLIHEQEDELILGDVVISLETARRQCKEYGHSLYQEVAYLTIHGVLHLLGYDHQEEQEKQEMQNKEQIIIKNLKFFR